MKRLCAVMSKCPAPLNKQPLEIYSRGKSYANILAANGFAHERELKLRAEAWDRLFTVLSPDVIVAESSPTACLAARGRIPLMAAGSGFDVPPADLAIFPAITSDCEPETNQALLRDTVNKVLKSRGIPVVDRLPGTSAPPAGVPSSPSRSSTPTTLTEKKRYSVLASALRDRLPLARRHRSFLVCHRRFHA